MIELVVGDKGTGKTRILMDKANNDIKVTGGNIVYLDQNNKHMYELSHRVRLINVPEHNIRSSDMFLGFVYGIVSQIHDLDRMFLDNFMTISCVEDVSETEALIKELEEISNKYEVELVIGISCRKENLPESLLPLVSVAL